jgi:hypothetical protein
LVKLIYRTVIDHALQHICKIGVRLYFVKIGGLNKRTDGSTAFGSRVAASEEMVLTTKCHCGEWRAQLDCCAVPDGTGDNKIQEYQNTPKFTALHASIYNHFNQECHLYSHQNFKINRSVALAE